MGRPVTQRKTKIRLYPWDVVDHLDSEEAIVGYLNAVLEEDDPALLMAALGDVARAKGMTQVSRETGLGRESLYKALSLQGNPEFATVQKVLRSLGLSLRVSA
jgi:probable addiction module antidote protein